MSFDLAKGDITSLAVLCYLVSFSGPVKAVDLVWWSKGPQLNFLFTLSFSAFLPYKNTLELTRTTKTKINVPVLTAFG